MPKPPPSTGPRPPRITPPNNEPRILPPNKPRIMAPKKPAIMPPNQPPQSSQSKPLSQKQLQKMATMSDILQAPADPLSSKLAIARAGAGSDFVLGGVGKVFVNGSSYQPQIPGFGKMDFRRPTERTINGAQYFDNKALEAVRKKACGDKPNCQVKVTIMVTE